MTAPKPPSTIHGRRYPPPQPTRGALSALLVYVGLPVLGITLVLDVVLAIAVRLLFDRCYGVLCWLGNG
jgi:hypothetical protein